MQHPQFVSLALSCLILDLLLLVTLPVFGYLSLLMLLFVVPMMLAGGGANALMHLRKRHPHRCGWSALALAMGGVSLPYLILMVGLTQWKGDGGDIWQLILHLYLVILALRLTGAAIVNCLLAPLAAIFSRGVVPKLSSLSALLNCALGLYLYRELYYDTSALLAPLDQGGEASSQLILVVAILVCFGGGLVWGATVHWAADRLKNS